MNTTSNRSSAAAAAAAAAAMAISLTIVLGGCTTAETDRADGSPSPTTGSPEVTETVYGECLDGAATILADDLDAPFDLGDCATVSIVGVDGEITLGDVDRLVLEGDRNTVVVSRVSHVAFGGNGNAVRHGGDEPEIVDDGNENTVTPVD